MKFWSLILVLFMFSCDTVNNGENRTMLESQLLGTWQHVSDVDNFMIFTDENRKENFDASSTSFDFYWELKDDTLNMITSGNNEDVWSSDAYIEIHSDTLYFTSLVDYGQAEQLVELIFKYVKVK